MDLPLADILKRLSADTASIPWPECRALVPRLRTALAENRYDADAQQLVACLARHPKWEVRYDAAELLTELPQDLGLELARELAGDKYPYVARAGQRMLDDMQQKVRQATRRLDDLYPVQGAFTAMERRFGSEATDEARYVVEQALDAIVGACYHDLANMLCGVMTENREMLEMLRENREDRQRFLEYLTNAQRDLKKLRQTAVDMRDYCRPIPTARTTEWLTELVSQSVQLAVDAIRETGRNIEQIRVHTDVPDEIYVSVAREAFSRALLNVVHNAHKAFASGQPGDIYLRARQDASGTQLEIRDTGRGMSEKMLRQVKNLAPLSSFFDEGSGMGLATAGRVLRAHGGSLEIESREGKGTTVVLRLPSESTGAR